MPYERPEIVRRDPIAGLLVVARPSDVGADGGVSDVTLKTNIVAVSWDRASARSAYEPPEIAGREPIAGLLTVARPSDVGADGDS